MSSAPTPSYRNLLPFAALCGASSVALGAFGAHGLKAILDTQQLGLWQTGVHYQMFHSLALLALALKPGACTATQICGYAWLLGMLLFSGSLYALALGAPAMTGAITPLGGLLLLAGWLSLVRVKR